MPEYLSGEKN